MAISVVISMALSVAKSMAITVPEGIAVPLSVAMSMAITYFYHNLLIRCTKQVMMCPPVNFVIIMSILKNDQLFQATALR